MIIACYDVSGSNRTRSHNEHHDSRRLDAPASPPRPTKYGASGRNKQPMLRSSPLSFDRQTFRLDWLYHHAVYASRGCDLVGPGSTSVCGQLAPRALARRGPHLTEARLTEAALNQLVPSSTTPMPSCCSSKVQLENRAAGRRANRCASAAPDDRLLRYLEVCPRRSRARSQSHHAPRSGRPRRLVSHGWPAPSAKMRSAAFSPKRWPVTACAGPAVRRPRRGERPSVAAAALMLNGVVVPSHDMARPSACASA